MLIETFTVQIVLEFRLQVLSYVIVSCGKVAPLPMQVRTHGEGRNLNGINNQAAPSLDETVFTIDYHPSLIEVMIWSVGKTDGLAMR